MLCDRHENSAAVHCQGPCHDERCRMLAISWPRNPSGNMACRCQHELLRQLQHHAIAETTSKRMRGERLVLISNIETGVRAINSCGIPFFATTLTPMLHTNVSLGALNSRQQASPPRSMPRSSRSLPHGLSLWASPPRQHMASPWLTLPPLSLPTGDVVAMIVLFIAVVVATVAVAAARAACADYVQAHDRCPNPVPCARKVGIAGQVPPLGDIRSAHASARV